ncbi:2'-hydroxyisoflavone reductase [Thermosporothrix hazakensis]|jgi:2'-hydroxyisoflavone reductase|uniref:2'-hydroxyisoflavone reductase n=2 Tax=Thermosporothrix TaxID=768650 RepID=A0A326UCC0_THEHA|nr:NAD-dependent epimerase/dehydratase family protein [Thermosporothrix hazakensis]PZW36272.1 2'-hydroxyisoflavone reductase [Thermosporothrix hazakensis]BBH88737.1 hypothetical protein KTC_34880 [Thermosporothrix sp. COM3]GCE46921.1 hypothetical protein KTH_17900 [Thermosporothrix hazakensis]
MRLLILGGTKFLGRHVVDIALRRGHEVTLFNRGKTNPELFSQVEQIHGDRATDLHLLEGRAWDAVIDPSGYVPGVVRKTVEALASSVKHYAFISSISVYEEFVGPNADETYPVAQLKDKDTTEITEETYGPLKALCEQVVEEAFPGRAAIIRPGLIVGPWDPSNRFTYWPVRIAQGGEVLVPAKQQAVQIIDVRDLAAWTLDLVEQGKAGTYNATGPDYALTLQTVVETCKAVTGSDARFTPVSEEFLEQHEVLPWVGLPLWIPGDAGNWFQQVNIQRALDAGLRFRPLEETVRDTLAWAKEYPADPEKVRSLKPEQEQAVLQAWHTANA